MIRFLLGRRFRREPKGDPADRIGLELFGVDILVGANAEPLRSAVPELLGAVAGAASGQAISEVILPQSRLALIFARRGDEVELSVIGLRAPIGRRVGPVSVDLADLCRAAKHLRTEFAAALPASAHGKLTDPKVRPQLPARTNPLEVRLPSSGPGHFGFSWKDPRGTLSVYTRRSTAPLGSLLAHGEVFLSGPTKPVWSTKAPPFLAGLELVREAEEALRSLELGEQQLSFSSPGLARAEKELKLPAPDFLMRMFELGMAVAAFAVEHNRAQANNPFLRELLRRSRKGISALTTVRPVGQNSRVGPPLGGHRGPPLPQKRERPLSKAGALRRLRFDRGWTQKMVLEKNGVPRLSVDSFGVWVASAQRVALFSSQGKECWRSAGESGIALGGGHILVAEPQRLLYFESPKPSSLWIKSHDGNPIGPSLFASGQTLLVNSPGPTVYALDRLTGLELWRGAPPGSAQTFVSLADPCAVLTSNSGLLFGLPFREARAVFQLKVTKPFLGPLLCDENVFFGSVGEGATMAALCCDASTGALVWTSEWFLRRSSPPLLLKKRLFFIGEQEERAVLVCLDAKSGKLSWERSLHLGDGPHLLSSGKNFVVASSRNGTAARVEMDGRVSWRSGSGTDEVTSSNLASTIARDVVIVPGPIVRAIEAKSGQVLAEVKASVGLCGAVVDKKLNLYLLDEQGSVSAFRLATHLSTT